MREIKFRIYSNTLKVMYSSDNKIANLWAIPTAPNGVIKINEGDILMQFTGLKDKNGKDIYEGDIVVLNGEMFNFGNQKRIQPITFKSGMFTIGESLIPLSNFQIIEVIGNIYKNPELLLPNSMSFPRQRYLMNLKI